MSGMLSGIRVVEAATFVAGPAASTIMGDFGAEVIHVEPPGIGDPYRLLYQLRPLPECGENYPWLLDSRNKQSVVLNLKTEAGREAMYKLVATADVFLTNYQPSVLTDLGLRYEELAPLNERLIYAHITGYGEGGLEAERPGYDASAWWARSGMMDLVRARGSEIPMSAPGMGDHPTAVAMYGAIMTGLYRRERTGKGTKVATSLMANGVWANSIMAQAALCEASTFVPFTHREAVNPLMGVYETRDARAVFLVMVKEAFEWEMLCDAIEREDLKHDPRFETSEQRRANAPELVDLLDRTFAARDLAHWVAALERNRITFSIVQRYDQLPQDAQMQAENLFPEIADLPGRRTVDSPITVVGETKRAPHRAPDLGEHTLSVLASLGYDEAAIERLAQAGVIGS